MSNILKPRVIVQTQKNESLTVQIRELAILKQRFRELPQAKGTMKLENQRQQRTQVTGKYDSGEKSTFLGPNLSNGNNHFASDRGFPNQKGTVEMYIKEFEVYSAKICNQSEERLLTLFLRGLQHEIRTWVNALLPSTYAEAKVWARKVELVKSWGGDRSTPKEKQVCSPNSDSSEIVHSHPRISTSGDEGPRLNSTNNNNPPCADRLTSHVEELNTWQARLLEFDRRIQLMHNRNKEHQSTKFRDEEEIPSLKTNGKNRDMIVETESFIEPEFLKIPNKGTESKATIEWVNLNRSITVSKLSSQLSILTYRFMVTPPRLLMHISLTPKDSFIDYYTKKSGFWSEDKLFDESPKLNQPSKTEFAKYYGVWYAVWARQPRKPPDNMNFFAASLVFHGHKSLKPLKTSNFAISYAHQHHSFMSSIAFLNSTATTLLPDLEFPILAPSDNFTYDENHQKKPAKPPDYNPNSTIIEPIRLADHPWESIIYIRFYLDRNGKSSLTWQLDTQVHMVWVETEIGYHVFLLVGISLFEQILEGLYKISVHSIINGVKCYSDVKYVAMLLATRTEGKRGLYELIKFGDALAQIVRDSPSAAASAIAFTACWQLALIILVLIPLIEANGFVQMKFSKGFSADAKKTYEKASWVATDAVGGIRTVAYFCAANFYAGAWVVEAGKATFSYVSRENFPFTMVATTVSNSSSFGPDTSKAKTFATTVFGLLYASKEWVNCPATYFDQNKVIQISLDGQMLVGHKMVSDVVMEVSIVEKLVAQDISKNREQRKQWMVAWQMRTNEDETMKHSYFIPSRLPNFRLEDKPGLYGGGIDREYDMG